VPRKYPPEIKQRALELAAQGLNSYQIARSLNVSQSTTYRWLNPEMERAYLEHKMQGVCPKCGGRMALTARMCGHCSRALPEREEVIRRVLAGHNAFTIAMALGRDEEWASKYITHLRKHGDLPRLGWLG
jgi:transposase-like protein